MRLWRQGVVTLGQRVVRPLRLRRAPEAERDLFNLHRARIREGDLLNGPTADARPSIIIVADREGPRKTLEQSVAGRYGRDYQVYVQQSPSSALELLRLLRNRGDEVALIIADHWMSGETGAGFLGRTREVLQLPSGSW